MRQIFSYLVDVGIERNIMLDRVNYIFEIQFLKFTYMEHVGKDNDEFKYLNNALCIASYKLGVVRCVQVLTAFRITR